VQELDWCKPANNYEPRSDRTSYFLTCENLSLRKKVAQPSMAIGFPEYTCDSKGAVSNWTVKGTNQINQVKET
jgi:hypothetical protein